MKLSNNNILKEWYKEPVEQKKVMIYPGCMSSSEASEIAEQEGLEKEWMGAKAWFEGVVESREEFELEEMPKYHNFVCHMDYIEADLYYDFAADYYFAVLNKLKTENMKKNKIRITESKLKQIVAESVKKVLREGKTINNKPFFSRAGRYMKPGEELHGYHSEGNEFLRQKGYENFHDAFGAVMRGELDKTTFDKWYDEHMKAVNKHNDRLEYNWDEGNYDDYNYKTLAVSDYDDNNY